MRVRYRAEPILKHLPKPVPGRKVRMAEVGVYQGDLSAYLLRIRPDLHLFMIDPWNTWNASDSDMKIAARATRFARRRRKLISIPSPKAADEIRDGFLDLVFIDGEHTFKAVRKDIKAWAMKLRPHGILCGHDWFTIRSEVDASRKFNVRGAVEQFAFNTGLPVRLGGNGTWFVQVPAKLEHWQLLAILKQQERNVGLETGAEIGVGSGETSYEILRCFPHLKLLMIDPWQVPDPKSEYAKSRDNCARLPQRKLEINYRGAHRRTRFAHNRRTIIRATSLEAVKQVPDQSLDFVFVDGDHTYTGCKADLDAWWPKLRPEALFCGHDYGRHTRRWGVQKAVDEFAKECGLKIEVGKGSVWWTKKDKR